MHVETATTGYSMKEEIVHSISHGIGALMSVVGLATLIMYSSMYGAALVPGGASYREAVRQQFNFSPPDVTRELEDHVVDLKALTMLELNIIPDMNGTKLSLFNPL